MHLFAVDGKFCIAMKMLLFGWCGKQKCVSLCKIVEILPVTFDW
jgi:hypothetical protein